MSTTAMNPLVVGVDGSPNSLAALTFALEEARLRGCDVTAVTTYRVPLPVMAPEAMWVAQIDEGEVRRSSEETLAAAVARVRATAPGVEVEQVVLVGSPAEVLCEASRKADLLIVGTRGFGGFKGLLLGSVSSQCVHHASCPVVVVPAPDSPEGS